MRQFKTTHKFCLIFVYKEFFVFTWREGHLVDHVTVDPAKKSQVTESPVGFIQWRQAIHRITKSRITISKKMLYRTNHHPTMSRKPTQHYPSTVGVGVATQRVLIGQQSLNVVSGHSIHTVRYTVVQCYFLCHAFFDV